MTSNVIPWLELYETAFLPHERLLVATQLRVMRGQAPEFGEAHTVCAVDGAGRLAGLMQYSLQQETSAAFLWYIAVRPELRNAGLGAEIYRELWRRLDAAGCRTLVFEVEIPERYASDEERELAGRRIGFYRRLGARLLTGIQHIQYVGPHQPATPMHVMVDSRPPLSPDAAFLAAKAVLEDSITRVGDLRLE